MEENPASVSQPVNIPTEVELVGNQAMTPETPKKSKLPFVLIGLLILGLLISVAYLFYQNNQLKQEVEMMKLGMGATEPTVSQSPTPTPDPTAGWKVYKYQDVFEIKIPNDLEVKNVGRIEIGDYLSVGVIPSNPENCRGDCKIIETKETKIISGLDFRYLTGWWGEIGGNVAQSYVTYVIPHNSQFAYLQMQELPFFVHDSVRQEVGKVSQENSELLDQILSTFEFVGEGDDPTIGWETYVNSEYGYSIEYPGDFKTQVLSAGSGVKIAPPDARSLYVYNSKHEESYLNRHISIEYFELEPTYGHEWTRTVVSFHGKNATKFTNPDQASNFDIYHIQLDNGQGLIEIYVANTQDKQSIANQILTTLEFTE